MRIASILILPVSLGLACVGPAPAEAADLLDRGGLAPYRLNPPPSELSPAEEGAMRAYRSQLQNQLNQLERDSFGADALEQEQLRGTRSELGRVERLLDLR